MESAEKPIERYQKVIGPYEIAYIVSGRGDSVDVMPNGHLDMVVYDICGSRVPRIFSKIKGALKRHYERNEGELSAEHIVSAANAIVCNRMSHRDPDFFLTAVYLSLADDGNLSFVDAGHGLGCVYRSNGCIDDIFSREETINPPIGVRENVDYKGFSERLMPGDALLLYTDGISAARNPAGEFFGEAAIRQHLAESHSSNPMRMAEGLYQAAKEFAAGRRQDDAAICAIKRLY